MSQLLTGDHSRTSRKERLAGFRSYIIGVLLLASGLFLLITQSPPGNVVLSRTSTYDLYVNSVPAYKTEDFPLTYERRSVSSASAINLSLSFQLRVLRFPDLTESSAAVVSVGAIAFPLSADGILSTVSPFTTGVWYPSLGYVPANQWQTIRLSSIRSHSLTYWLDGVQRYSFSFDGPRWVISPLPVKVGLARHDFAVVQIRDLQLRVVTYGPAHSLAHVVSTRFLQFAAALLIAIASALLASRLLRRVMQPATRGTALVIVAVGTAALGIIAELVYEAASRPPTEPHDAIAWWLYDPYWRFTDYFQTLALLRSRNPYGFPGGTYPPFGYWILEPFAWMKDYPSLFCAEALFIGFIAWLSWAVIGKHLAWPFRFVVVIVLLFSLPVTFALDRGNTDFILAVLFVVGASAFERRRHFLSATMYALAGAAKILPILYLAMFLRRRRIFAFLFGLLVAGAVTTWAFTAFAPIGLISTQITELRTSLRFQAESYKNPAVSTPFNASITGFIQAIGYAFNGVAGANSVAPTAQHYVVVEELVGSILVVLFIVFVERRPWRALTLLTAALLLLPEVSEYYSLIFLLAPFVLFVGEADMSKRNIAIAVLFGLLLAPKTFAFFGVGAPLIDSSTLVTAPLLIALSAIVAVEGMRERGGIRGLSHSVTALARSIRLSPPIRSIYRPD